MKKIYIYLFLLFSTFGFTQSSTCETASAMCEGQGGPYVNTTGGPNVGAVPVACGSNTHGNGGFLGSLSPNPAWFSFQIGVSGPITLNLQQFSDGGGTLDVDFALWGPFNNNNLGSICSSLYNYQGNTSGPCNLVDASYDSSYNENVHFPNAIAGEIYILLVTNYSDDAGTYSINQIDVTPSSGQISCNVVCGVNLGSDQFFCNQFISSYTLVANFNQPPTTPGTPTYSWYLGGSLQATTTTNSYTVNQSGTWSVSVIRPGCSDIATDEVEIRFAAPPVLNTPNNLNAPNGACSHTFNLRDVELDMLNPALPSNYVIKYYLDEGDCFAGNGNFIVDPTAFTVSSTTTIYVRVENLGNPSCSNSEQYFDVVINCIPTACSISLSSPAGTNNQNICQGDALTNILYTTSGTVTNVTVSGLPTGLTTNFSSNTFTISGTPTQTGTFNYIVTTEGCSPELSQNGTIVVNSLPSVPVISMMVPTCSSDGVSTITNYNAAASYVFSPSGPTVGAGGLISGMTIGTSYTVTATVGSCTSAPSSPFVNNLMLATPNTPNVALTAESCSSNGVASISNYVSGLTYIFDPLGPTVNTSGVVSGMTPGVNYFVYATNGSCASANSSLFAINNMLTVPATPIITSVASTCLVAGSSSISNYNQTYIYNFNPAGPSVGLDGVITGMTIGIPYVVTSFNGTCTSDISSQFSNENVLESPVAPTLLVASSLVCSGETAIFQINGETNNVITYSIDGGSQQEITLNTQGSGVVEVVTSSANVSIQLLNINNGNCSLALTNSATVAVQLCSIPKGISPNGDGKNDVWDLSNFDIKKVEIFNRYGTKVYSKSNYENEWHGQSDNGNDLPDGTYYFVIDFTDLETKSGWIYINREH